jgi:hypothetical protein
MLSILDLIILSPVHAIIIVSSKVIHNPLLSLFVQDSSQEMIHFITEVTLKRLGNLFPAGKKEMSCLHSIELPKKGKRGGGGQSLVI